MVSKRVCILSSTGLSAFEAAITAYQAKTPAPRNAVAQKIMARASLEILFKETDSFLKEQVDKIVGNLQKSHPSFVTAYKANRSIVDAAHSVTTLSGVVLDAGTKVPVSGTVIEVLDTDIKATAGEDGAFEIRPIPAGLFTVNITAPKYNSQSTGKLRVKRGQTTRLNLTLEQEK